MSVGDDEGVVRIVLRRLVLPLVGGLAIGWLAQALIPWQVLVAVVGIGAPIFVVRELRWIKRQRRELAASQERLNEFLAHYDRRRAT